jgi:16S rRNA (adenine1518-N6/adenine1519-N6)-dimethyltransferase
VLRSLVRRGFGQRRKTLRRSLALPGSTFAAAGVDPGDRPEQLGVDAWCRLAAASTTTTDAAGATDGPT